MEKSFSIPFHTMSWLRAYARPRLLIFHSTMSLSLQKILLSKFLMTSLHVIWAPPIKNPGYTYGNTITRRFRKRKLRHNVRRLDMQWILKTKKRFLFAWLLHLSHQLKCIVGLINHTHQHTRRHTRWK